MSKIFTVWGATGNQGGSVIEAILADPILSKEFKIRGITRDAKKPAALALAAKGVEIVEADMSTPEKAAPAVQGAHTVYLVTNFWESMSGEVEVAQGKAVTDAAKAAGVKHLVFSSLIDTAKASAGRLTNISHFDSKAVVERYIRDSGINATFVLPGIFMTGFFQFIRKGEDGSYTLAMPVGAETAQFPVFDVVADTGKFVTAALKKYPNGAGDKLILAATDYYTPARIVSEFSEVIGKPAKYVQIDNETFKSFLPPTVAQELLENMLLMEDPGYYAGEDLTETLNILESKPKTWKEFVEENKAKWL